MSLKPPTAGTPGVSTSATLEVQVGAASGTDDTTVLQAALNTMTNGSTLKLTSGQTYKASNLVIPNLSYITIDLNGSTIRSTGTGDASYLIATYNWVNDITTPGAQMALIRNGTIIASADGTAAGGKTYGLVTMSSRFRLEKCDVSLASSDGVRQDAQTKNGSDVSANVVECRFTENRLHDCGAYNFRSNDPTTYRNTDGFFEGNLCFNAGTSNIRIDKGSGWIIDEGNHTYQFGGGATGSAFTPGTNWDLDIEDVGIGCRVFGNYFESGCVQLGAITQTHSPKFDLNHLGLTAPSGAILKIVAVSTGNDSALPLVGNVFYGPTSGGNYTTALITGPTSGTPLRVIFIGGSFGFRNPVSWTNQVRVFFEKVSLMQTSAGNLPTDLVIDGFMPTSGARPPGVVWRSAAPSTGAENWVVGDRVRHPAPAVGSPEGWIVTTAGATGTAVFTALANLGSATAGVYQRVAQGWQRFDAQATSTGLVLAENSSGGFGAASAAKGVFYVRGADYAVAGMTTKYKVRLTLLTNDTAPTSTFTANLNAVGAPSGAAATVAVSSTSVPASAAQAAPAADTAYEIDSSDVTLTDGFYALSLAISVASMVASSSAFVRIELFVHNV